MYTACSLTETVERTNSESVATEWNPEVAPVANLFFLVRLYNIAYVQIRVNLQTHMTFVNENRPK